MATSLIAGRRRAESEPGAPRTRIQAVAPNRQRRRSGLVAGALLLALLGAMAVSTIGARLSSREGVLLLVRDVPFGAVVAADDLGTTQVAVEPGVDVVPAADRGSVIGRVAGADLFSGTLVSEGLLREAAPPGQGQVLVPIPVPADRLPAGGLSGGDRLEVVDAPTSAAAAESARTTPARAFAVEAVRVGTPDVSGVSVLDVAVAEGDGRALAALAATGEFALVVLPAGAKQ